MEITDEHLMSHNWFDYADFYDEMAARPDFKVYVELGCWKGHSVCHLAKRLKDKKDAVVYAVDYWDSADTLEALNYLPEDSPSLYAIYNRNLEIAGVRCLVQDIKGCSWETASRFKDESVDFVYLDADHSTESVMRDIKAWWPKLKPMGIMAGGHDYNWDTVRSAVRNVFNDGEYGIQGNVWIVHKQSVGRSI
jgi:predicted O-methyltransferase YrrM